MSEPAPPHWATLVGPANWFQLHYPPQWEVEERDGTFAIRPEGSEAFLAINTIWTEAIEAKSLPVLNDIVNQFPKVRNVSAETDLAFKADESLSGEANLVPSGSWLQKLFVPGKWQSWSMWSLRRSRLLLIITLLHEGDRDPEMESIVRMMLMSMEICEEPADPPEVFAQKALDLARSKFPLLEVKLVEGFQIQIDSSWLNLGNFYRAYIASPDRFESILLPALTTAVQVQGWGERESMPPLEIVRDRVMPMLYPETLWQENLSAIVGTPWIAGLVVLYVVDESNAYWYVRDELLEQWNMSEDELHELALENLDDYFEQSPMEMAVAQSEEGQATMMMPDKPDTYNTVRLLSDRFLTRMREVVQGDLAVGAPGRDVFVAVSMKSPEIIKQVRTQVSRDYQQTDHPLTDRMLLVTADGVSELIAEAENDD